MKTQQKSDHRIVAQGPRKLAPIGGPKRKRGQRGAKSMTVTQETRQLKLPFGTAEHRGKSKPKSDGNVEAHPRAPKLFAEPKPNGKSKQILSVTMEEMVEWLE